MNKIRKIYWRLKRKLYEKFNYYIVRGKLNLGLSIMDSFKISEQHFYNDCHGDLTIIIHRRQKEFTKKYDLLTKVEYQVATIEDDFAYSLITLRLKFTINK